jgi:threonine aldolase
MIDLRSDTVTHPTPEMRNAMAQAEVGDDGLEGDPTVIRLQERAASILGKEAGLFVPSGTMGNIVSLLAQAQPGDEIMVGDRSHIFLNEVGGASALGGIQTRQVPNESNGTLDLNLIEKGIRRSGGPRPASRLLCLENTHNYCWGAALSIDYVAAASDLAHRNGLKIHVDGARIFNAAISLGVSVDQLVADADSVTFCLSKGLSCPVGSIVCGSSDFIATAHRIRRMLGGGMRQVGILAAAGLYALDNMVDRLSEDHVNAQRLAKGLASIPGLSIDPEMTQTNIVIAEVQNGDVPTLLEELSEMNLLGSYIGDNLLRMVTHYGIEEHDIDQALDIMSGMIARRQS